MNVQESDWPLWTRHDRAGRAGAPLSSHSFVKNLKAYADEAGIKHIHLHQTRHTFARIYSEDSGSMTETQEALDHEHVGTTRAYVQTNQWVALDGDRLLAHGFDARSVYLSAREAGVRAPYLTRVEPRDELPFAGW